MDSIERKKWQKAYAQQAKADLLTKEYLEKNSNVPHLILSF